ncbi:MAG: PstS family phosphate ABC transporter substrate-binding protein [Planctomycetes bacterium]|nr:PstS family phosphate ABC transporter substrate-binding protein [Planctomycetota bacterium]
MFAQQARRFWASYLAMAMFAGCVLGCGSSGTEIAIDGSSTVYPISEAAAEEFGKAHPQIRRPTVGFSGTGGGFKRFCAGETDISDASRPIRQPEFDLAKKNGIEYIELPVAYDGLSVMVNPANEFVESMTVAELKRTWEPESKVQRWSDIRPNWPDRPIHLYGAGTDSGTFDYFTEAIMGKEKACRSDFQASEDDNALVQGTAGDQDAMGFFGYAYYVQNTDKLKLIAIDNGGGPVLPSEETIIKGTYQPLSRPLFIYVKTSALSRPEVEAFVRFYLDNAKTLAAQVGYVALPDAVYALAKKRFEERKTGTVFGGKGSRVGVTLEDLLKQEGAGL